MLLSPAAFPSVSSYGPAPPNRYRPSRCLVLSSRMSLSVYAYAARSLRAPYAMSGTDLAYAAMGCPALT
eukprot:2484367-Rhodomonas_salina.1